MGKKPNRNMERINNSAAPAHEAGVFLKNRLEDHAGKSILLLLSGGSSLAVLANVDTTVLGSHITMAMADERFTIGDGNNFTQLAATEFYTDAKEAGVQFIDSRVDKNESHELFAKRLATVLHEYCIQNPNAYIIGLFGIGHDCHTASIFPKQTIEEFNSIYDKTSPLIPVDEPNDQYHKRVTVTPAFINSKVDELLIYAAGKQETLLSLTFAEQEHECPALILTNHQKSSMFTDAEIPSL